MKKIKTEEIKNFDYKLIEELKQLEISAFGDEAAANQWILPVLIRYGKVIASKQDNKVIGLCLAIRDWGDESKAFIHSLHVKEDYQNKGIGKKLLSKVLNIFKEYGIKKVSLTVDPENKIAITLYKNFGFKIIHTEKHEYGKNIDRYLMELKLT